jgi:hypothetical protein
MRNPVGKDGVDARSRATSGVQTLYPIEMIVVQLIVVQLEKLRMNIVQI